MTHKEIDMQKHADIKNYLIKYHKFNNDQYLEMLFEHAYVYLDNYFKNLHDTEMSEYFISVFTRGGSEFWNWWYNYYKQVNEYIYRTILARMDLSSMSITTLINKYEKAHTDVKDIYPSKEVFTACAKIFTKQITEAA